MKETREIMVHMRILTKTRFNYLTFIIIILFCKQFYIRKLGFILER